MAGHPAHRRHHPVVERRLAEFLARQLGVDGDHLHHMPPQDGEVRFLHRLHEPLPGLILPPTSHHRLA